MIFDQDKNPEIENGHDLLIRDTVEEAIKNYKSKIKNY